MGIDLAALESGFSVLLVGFSLVFSFLVILICCMFIMHKVIEVINKWFPPAAAAVALTKSAKVNIEDEIAVAIAACFLKQRG